MKTLVLNSKDIQLLHSPKLNIVMKEALIALSQQAAVNYKRHVVGLKSDAALGFMPATFSAGNLFGYKAVSVFAENTKRGLNPHQGFVVLLNSQDGTIRALLEGSIITALRTAAVSSVATEFLSRADSTVLALMGAGRQAFEHALAVTKVRPIKKIIIFNRTRSLADQLVQKLALEIKSSLEISIASSPQQAVKFADIVVTCTNSKDPLLSVKDFAPGTHINAIGACRPGNLEILLQNHTGLKIYLDSLAACAAEASEIINPIQSGALDRNFIQGEIGEFLSDQIAGRTNPDDITFFKSVGLGVQDLFAADYFYQEAIKKNFGQYINFGISNEPAIK